MPKRTRKRTGRKNKSNKRRKINTRRRKRLKKKRIRGGNPLADVFNFVTGNKKKQTEVNPSEVKQGEVKQPEQKNEKCDCNNTTQKGFLQMMEGFFVKQKKEADSAIELLKSKGEELASKGKDTASNLLGKNKGDFTIEFLEDALKKYFKDDDDKALELISFIKEQQKEKKNEKDVNEKKDLLKKVAEDVVPGEKKDNLPPVPQKDEKDEDKDKKNDEGNDLDDIQITESDETFDETDLLK